ncbi:hypothetical protein Bca52824_003790 [Brassica carinata]|uniref:F-box associated beta-propeller type 1 domain-containing protein n=1 Tax=Brassica carinata TaxID=52824 RepID=A0A8X7WPG3_BRACI|nr:hypothetical protein Bca52824_003790 [Brassica carinata]
MNIYLVGESFQLCVEQDKRNWVQLAGSSNGLVCISPADDVVFLYNPTTRESNRVPDSAATVPCRYREKYQSYGFGFDHLTHDYKVVKLVSDKKNNLLYACVYSLKSNWWRWICDLNYEHSNRFPPSVTLNGVIHWVVFTRLQQGSDRQRVILAFDIITQEFRREVPFPEAEDCPNSFKDFVVGNLNEHLCVFYNCRRELLHDDIWVMNEYGVASSWTRIRISLLYKWMKPVCSTGNSDEEVLLVLDGDMVLFNLETHAWTKIQGVKLQRGFDVNTYVESLVSPNLYVGFHNCRNHLGYNL